MIIVGICCVLFCFLYTTKLSYLGLGDLLVLLFSASYQSAAPTT